MPRTLDPEIKKLLNDEKWLREQHVTNLFGIVEIARDLNVTPAVVRRAIRKFNIESPSQQQLREASNLRKYGVKNPGQLKEVRKKAVDTMTKKYGGHIFSTKEGRQKRDLTCLKKYGNSNAAKSDTIKEKIKKTKLKDKHNNLVDAEWLYEQHYINNKSINEIAIDLNVTWATVKAYFNDANIKIRPNSTIPHNTEKFLLDKDWLLEQHHTQRKPFSIISRELGVQDDTVRRYAKRLEIPFLQHSNLPQHVYDKLTDIEWLTEQCVVQMKNFKQLGEELNVSPSTVADYCKKIHVVGAGKNRKLSNDVLLKLTNYDWLYDQHINQRKSTVHIGHELGIHPTTVQTHFHNAGIDFQYFSHSTGEKEVLSFIQSLLPNTEIHENTQRVISPYELDIYIPEHNLAIEYCGLYWHSDKFKENYYHRNKLHACQQKNIRLLTIFEDEWRDRQFQVKNKIKNLLKLNDNKRVYARQTHIVNVTTKTKNQFLNEHHIQGTGPGSVTYGLQYDNQLVAVMTFIKKKPLVYELNRYATSCSVVGGFSKLLKYFQQNQDWKQIVSFADLRISDGNLYEKTGWKLDKILPPDYYWVRNNQRFHKFNFRHKFLKDKLEQYDPTLSENENCKNNGYNKIYNCGLKRYVINKTVD